MGSALYIVPEGELSIDSFISGKPMARAMEALDLVADAAGVPALFEFLDASEFLEEFGDFEDDLDPEGLEDQKAASAVLWFEPAAGLKTVDALLQALKNHPETTLGETPLEDVVEDLQDLRQVLVACQKENVRFHLSVDC